MSRLASLNHDIVDTLRKEIDSILRNDPDADLSPLLAGYASKYATRRGKRATACGKSDQPKRKREIIHEPALNVGEDVEILFPVQRAVMEVLRDIQVEGQDSLAEAQVLLRKIENAIQSGQQLQKHAHNLVSRIHDEFVVKTVSGRDDTEVCALRHVQEKSDKIPAPKLLGAVSSGRLTHIIMSYVDGDSLQDVWPQLPGHEKATLQRQMEDVLRDIRSLDLPSQYYGCGSPPVCRDLRTDNRQSAPYISSEEDFNSFILSNPKCRVSKDYLRFIADEVLKCRYDRVMTHGDFTRRNIIVARAADGSLVISGVIDWEAAGAYPEYWEYVKMLHTISSNDNDDWLQYIPRQAGKDFTGEWTKQLLIDRISR